MTDGVAAEFACVCSRRFGSLGEAVSSLLDLLERQLPAGRVVLGELDYDIDEFRLLDARGDGLETLRAGTSLSLTESFCVHMASGKAPALTGDASDDPVYANLDLHKSFGVRSYVAAPVDLRDGTRVASLAAMSTAQDQYSEGDRDLVTIAARLVAYEWECVTSERKLRRLTHERHGAMGDAIAGLPLRDAFLEQLDREWHLAHRGITESYVVAVSPDGIGQARKTFGDAVADLILQSACESIVSEMRRTDIAGRVADDLFALALVGCKGVEGAEAFCSRLAAVFERKLSGRPEKPRLAFGLWCLNDAESAASALKRAEEALRKRTVAPSPSEA